jgi:hypothetical protein
MGEYEKTSLGDCTGKGKDWIGIGKLLDWGQLPLTELKKYSKIFKTPIFLW